MFSVEERDRVRGGLLERAGADARIVAAAEVGGLAGGGDRYSDLDLTFGVADGSDLGAVLADWTRELAAELEAAHLFDLHAGPSVYRVFLLPGCLQVDLSFTPAGEFGALGPRFRLLWGEEHERAQPEEPTIEELLGLGAHHAVRALVCLEREQLWQAEYWLSGVRDEALALACARRGLPARYARGFDRLPPEVLGRLEGGLPGSLEPAELRRALGVAVRGLRREAEGVSAAVDERLAELLEESARHQ